MIVGIKDSLKLFGISVMLCCAVTVCNLFLNFDLDLRAIGCFLENLEALAFYDALRMTSKVVCGVTGACLAATTGVMLVFYIKHYIDRHAREIGILKALGYSNLKIAKSFSVFALNVFLGCLLGYLLSLLLMPMFYEKQNVGNFLPHLRIKIHWILFLPLVLLPTLAFGVIAVGYSLRKLDQPCVNLLKGIEKVKGKNRAGKDKVDFVSEMRSSVLRSRKVLVFFIFFSAFIFSDTILMSVSMRDIASDMMGLMIFLIGVVLAFTTLYIAVSTVIRSNQKSVAMMRVFGYDAAACKRAVLDGYRPAAYFGFAVGTVYQYAMLRIMVELVFAGVEGVPEYRFDFPVCCVTFVSFVLIYEGILYGYGRAMRKIPLKQIMTE